MKLNNDQKDIINFTLVFGVELVIGLYYMLQSNPYERLIGFPMIFIGIIIALPLSVILTGRDSFVINQKTMEMDY